MFSNKKSSYKGRIFKAYYNGVVNTVSTNKEVGYLMEKEMRTVIKESLSGSNLDLFIKSHLHIPATLVESVEKMFEEIKNKIVIKHKTMKYLKTEILKEFLSEQDFYNLIEGYKKHLRKNKTFGREDRVTEMYNDYINGMKFEEIAQKYNFKRIGRVEMLISRHALQLNKTGFKQAPRRITKLMINNLEDHIIETIKQNLNKIDDLTAREIIRKRVIENQTIESISNELNISKLYIYKKLREEIKKYV